MRKRRRTKYIWLPLLGAEPNDGDDETQSNTFNWSCNASITRVGKPASIALFPLVEDTPTEEVVTANPDPNITDFIGTDYVIKRIVGKCTVALQNVAADQYFAVAVTAGMFVARADDQQALLPIGASTNALAISNYDPNYVDNIREPWIWRRTWVLSNPSSTNGSAVQLINAAYPQTNVAYGSIQDGPHIDAKTGRRVRGDERLWFAATCRGISLTGVNYATQPTSQQAVAGVLDLRVLGALRRAKNRSNF